MRQTRLSPQELHKFLEVSGYCFEQSIPLRGAAYRSAMTELTPLEWIDYSIGEVLEQI